MEASGPTREHSKSGNSTSAIRSNDQEPEQDPYIDEYDDDFESSVAEELDESLAEEFDVSSAEDQDETQDISVGEDRENGLPGAVKWQALF